MTERITISETRLQPLKGEYPEVATYPHVDITLLYQGDDDPFHVTLPIAEIGRVSDNGLVYDRELVTAIAEQMSGGAGGIRGHIPDDELSTAYPIDEVHWIGHQLVGETLWAKGYLPPGQNRDDVRRKKARGGNIATSIFGDAVKELIAIPEGRVSESNRGTQTWRARNFQLEQIDLAPTKRAALKNRKGFQITREMQEGEMPDVKEIVTAADVPQHIREQIVRESEVAKKAERVSELEKQNTDLQTQVKELAQYKSIVAEIRTTLGENADIPTLVAEYYGAVSKLTTMLGVKDVASISVRVEEMQTVVAEFEKKAFDGAVETQVAELTNWKTTTVDGQKKVDTFRKNFKRTLVAELGSERAPEKIAEVAKVLWDGEYSILGQAIVAELGGPAALVGGKVNPALSGGSQSGRMTDEERESEGKRFVKA